jgi:predicted NodU family carbamoyl transferase
MKHLVILGLSIDEGIGAAAILENGVVVASCQEQRQDSRICFPKKSVLECLRISDLDPASIDAVCLARKPFMKFEQRLESRIAAFPQGWLGSGFEIFKEAHSELGLSRSILRELSTLTPTLGDRSRLFFVDRLISLASWSYFTSPYHNAVVVVGDEGNKKNNVSILTLTGQGNKLKVVSHCTEECDEKLIRDCIVFTNKINLCLVGNFAMSDWISRLRKEFVKSSIWHPSGSCQQGASIGAAMAVFCIYFGRTITVSTEKAKLNKFADLGLLRLSDRQQKGLTRSMSCLRSVAVFIVPLLLLLIWLTRFFLRRNLEPTDFSSAHLPGMPTPVSFHDQY